MMTSAAHRFDPRLLDAQPDRSEAVVILHTGMRLGAGGPNVTHAEICALAEGMARRRTPVFSSSSTGLGLALVKVGRVDNFSLDESPEIRDRLSLSVVVTWDLKPCRDLFSRAADGLALLRPALSLNVSFRPFAITHLFVAAPGEAILQGAS